MGAWSPDVERDGASGGLPCFRFLLFNESLTSALDVAGPVEITVA